jgi:hypothetical protein
LLSRDVTHYAERRGDTYISEGMTLRNVACAVEAAVADIPRPRR